ncbi:hypothetical protein [Hydrogenophaga sp. PAMC20947]|uniref:hypothetical protein n=1 Tax=Hydrogenophaga sp. PAMC20947 TaxID=2565558 RepID=UPI00109E1A20|nr:hypothetical protein [Hydrogenophaga sp. PAMC20947]QCB47215.1 hypothetical protein E5678_14980 [Hydrogenophaga sp. PAMC20947]
MTTSQRLRALAVVALLFGALTVFSGGRALFGGAAARAAVGNAVDFVLWFNFLAGFLYMLAGWGLLRRQAWARHLSTLLALSTAAVATAFAVHAVGGGAFEARTVGALMLRLGFWVVVAWVAHRSLRGAQLAASAEGG